MLSAADHGVDEESMKAVARGGRLEALSKDAPVGPHPEYIGLARVDPAHGPLLADTLERFVREETLAGYYEDAIQELARDVPVGTGACGRPGVDRDRRPRGPRPGTGRGARPGRMSETRAHARAPGGPGTGSPSGGATWSCRATCERSRGRASSRDVVERAGARARVRPPRRREREHLYRADRARTGGRDGVRGRAAPARAEQQRARGGAPRRRPRARRGATRWSRSAAARPSTSPSPRARSPSCRCWSCPRS